MATLNTASAARDEGNWRLDSWNPRITTDAAMDSFVSTLLQRANDYIQFRVGTTWYSANSGSAPWSTLLKEAEMHLAQAYLLQAAAGVRETADNHDPGSFDGSAPGMLQVAADRRTLAEALILGTRAGGSQARPLLPADK
jgi:hypothetical protein